MKKYKKRLELAKTLFDLNMITATGSISNQKANELRLQSMAANLGNAFAQLNAGSKSAALIAIRLDQIKAVANAYGAFGQYMDQDPPRPGLAAAALAKGLANAAIIEKQASKARAAATGADFVTQGFTNDYGWRTGRERVQVTPLGNE